jgi:hypothetical protein
MYIKNGYLACKNRAKWVGWGGFGRVVLEPTPKLQKTSQVLDFQGLSDTFKCLIFKDLALLQKNLSSA